MSRAFATLFCLLLTLPAVGAKAYPNRYVLRVYGKKYQTNVVQLYDRRSSRTVWTRTCSLAGAGLDKRDFFWSSDHQAVAFAILPKDFHLHGHYEGFQLVVWRAGRPARIFAHQRLTADDGVEEMVWSPDGKRVLVRASGSGMAEDNYGRLYCVSSHSATVSFVAEVLGKPSRVGPRTVRYWKPRREDIPWPDGQHGYRLVKARRASFWHLPKSEKQ